MYIERVIRVTDLTQDPRRGFWDEPVICDRELTDMEHEQLCDEVLRQRMNLMHRKDIENFRVFVVSVRAARTFDEVMQREPITEEVIKQIC